MTAGISEHYRQLEAGEVSGLAAKYADAWKDPLLPWRQHSLVVARELERFRHGEPIKPYAVLLECLKTLPVELNRPTARLLDVGASTGYYSEVLRLSGWQCDYTALDYSQSYKDAAEALFPSIHFEVGDARELPFDSDSFDIVLHGACIMHCADYERAIDEAQRVARKFIIFHRTPVSEVNPTVFYEKLAYGIPCIEACFSETELIALFRSRGLQFWARRDVFFNAETRTGHRSYVLRKS